MRLSYDVVSRLTLSSPIYLERVDAVSQPRAVELRVFEVDALDRSVEITEGDTEPLRREYSPPTIAWTPLAEEESGTGPVSGSGADPTDSILDSIRATTGRQPGGDRPSPRRNPWKSFWNRIFPPDDPF